MAHKAWWVRAILAVGAITGGQADAAFPEKPQVTLTDVECPYFISLGDLNNDGNADLAVTGWVRKPEGRGYDNDKTHVDVFYGKNGTFAQPADLTFVTKGAFGTSIGDFDRDGKADLVIASSTGRMHLYLGAEDLKIDHSAPNNNAGVRVIQAGKLSRSGICDFIDGPVWRKWYGGEKFRNGYVYGPKINDNGGCRLADLDADDNTDLVYLPRQAKTQEVRLYYGPMLAMRVDPRALAQFVTLKSPVPVRGLETGDLNGDLRPDVITATSGSPQVKDRAVFIYYQNIPIDFSEGADPSTRVAGIGGHIAPADVNDDGLTDLIVAENGTNNGRIAVFLQKKGQPFATSVDQADQVIRVRGLNYAIAVADINGDGLPDIASSCPHRKAVRFFINEK